ncbi:MAG: hypothetical protein RLZZ502_815 [Pseudomonadota bacterium]|jgi:uncharacterized membrane protein YoaK (UPF0700 family)
MFAKLPRWVEVGGFWLAAIAGSVNAIGLLGFQHQGISHLTGTSTLFGLALVKFELTEAAHLFFIILSFMGGAALSGVIIDGAVLRLGRRYSAALFIEAALLLWAMVALTRGNNMGHFLSSAACGLQNGMVSTYSGAAIRTTHVSGLFTDLGTMLGARLRGHALDSRKALLFVLLITGFIVGGAVGAYGFMRMQFHALGFPASAALLLALAYWVHRHVSKKA